MAFGSKPGQFMIRRMLRANMTKAEKCLWVALRMKRLNGLRFRRQHGIGPFIADFYCPKLKLIIELDGGQHFEEDKIKYDLARTKYFKSLGMNVKRYTNLDVKKNLIAVMDNLFEFCGEGEKS